MRACWVVLTAAILSLPASAFEAPVGRSFVLIIDVTTSHRSASPSLWGWQPVPGGPTQPRAGARLPLWSPLETFRDALLPGDRVIVGAVGDRLMLDERPSSTKAVFEESMRRLMVRADSSVRWTTSPVWDAVDEAISALESLPPPRMVVLVTDGAATGNRLGIEEVAKHAVASGVAVHLVVGLDSKKDPEINPSSQARRLAEATGGFFESYASIRGRGSNELGGPAFRMKQLMRRLAGGATSSGPTVPPGFFR